MKIGAIYPQTELATEPTAIRAYAAGVEELGYSHILSFDHVVGADPAVHKGWDRPYDIDTTFHEPLVLYGFLAAITSLELVTGIIIGPQRQTALLAKQAAEVDILTEGRFRLGMGVGWNTVEYEALGQDFSTRGKREEEQIGLLRRLWTERSVTFDGQFDRVTGAGISPSPVQRPIPLWLGGSSPAAYSRIGRLADGWFPGVAPGPQLDQAKAEVNEAAQKSGRDSRAVGMEGRVSWKPGGAGEVADQVEQWRAAGATHVTINTMGAGLKSVSDHLAALEATAQALGLGN
ncbi:MAG: LLM class F420-dependent oxidoreductase [Acidimicrobiales bacterium]|jgi:probable F420-dependent oxidoreductase